ncbi:MAG: type II toxin-antitoxin system prevent-host-death family antitoxin [Streptosporangiales bacterium]|nr:type II toxin-antitoxin system prevent-host-death family antitoxin [Streptosporangiales bacterium]
MIRIGVRELNQQTSRYIALAKAGETIEITERGQLVARLVPVERETSILDRMIARGDAIPATRDWHSLPPLPRHDDGVNVADLLAEMREEERW